MAYNQLGLIQIFTKCGKYASCTWRWEPV